MLEIIKELLLPSQYIPHGHCYLWQTPLVGLHVAGDGLIALAYYAISLTLIFFVRKRPDLPFKSIFWLFGAFIIACGTTHLTEIWTLWYPTYWTSGVMKLCTAGISLYTGIALIPIIPKVLSLRSPRELEVMNHKLQQEIVDRLRAEVSLQEAKEELERRVLDRTADLERVNAQLRVSEATLLEAQQIAHIGNWKYDLEIDQVFWSREIFYIFGLEPALFAPPLSEIISCYPIEDGELLQQSMQQTMETGKPYHLQLKIYRPDGELRITENRARAEFDPTGKITRLYGTTQDITDLKKVETLKDEFVSTVSHELRTPLTSIRGSLGLLLSGRLGELSLQGKRMLEIAVNNTDRLVRLINDILDLELIEARKVTFLRESCNVAELVRQAVEVVQPLAEKAEVKLVVKTLAMQIRADPDRLIQTFTNLLGNAIKFSPPQTEIAIETSIDTTLNPNRLMITFQDQGRGIPPDKLQTIFGRFQQVDASDSRQKGGTGLGLAICQSIIQQHEGKIWAESTVGQGSTFFVALPLDQKKSITSELKQPWLTTNNTNNNKLILIVEDDLDLARILMITFTRHGFETIHAVNGSEAINFCQQIMPDLLILDLAMPSINGYMVVKWLRDHLPQFSALPLLIYSAKELNNQEQVILQLGKTEFLIKSRITPEFLEKRVMTLLEN